MKIVFRADGGSVMGIGHIIRSSALMHITQPHFDTLFVTNSPEYFPVKDFKIPAAIRKTVVSDYKKDAEDLAVTLDPGSIVVLDGYHFDTAYQSVLKKAGCRLVCIDDIMSYRFLADAVINHAGGISPEQYSCSTDTKLFLGPAYSLVRPVFYETEKPMRDLSDNKLVVCLGGADPNNDTEKILGILNNAGDWEVHVVLGSANKNIQGLRERFAAHSNIIFHVGLTGKQLAELMTTCSYAVLTPSTVCYEYMTIGGIVYLHQIADNQKDIMRYFIQEGLAFDFADKLKLSDEVKLSSLKKQEKIFDGKSRERLLKVFYEL